MIEDLGLKEAKPWSIILALSLAGKAFRSIKAAKPAGSSTGAAGTTSTAVITRTVKPVAPATALGTDSGSAQNLISLLLGDDSVRDRLLNCRLMGFVQGKPHGCSFKPKLIDQLNHALAILPGCFQFFNCNPEGFGPQRIMVHVVPEFDPGQHLIGLILGDQLILHGLLNRRSLSVFVSCFQLFNGNVQGFGQEGFPIYICSIRLSISEPFRSAAHAQNHRSK